MALINKFFAILDAFLQAFVGYRKFLIMLLIFAGSGALLIHHSIDGAQWVSLMTVVVPAYMATNSVEHITNTAQQWLDSKINTASTSTTNTTTTTTVTPDTTTPN